MNDRTVGYAVKVLRERKGLTQDGLALASGVSQGSVWSLEAGRLGRMTVRTIRKILAEVDADGSMSIWWREGIIDLLLDERHATLLGLVAKELSAYRWEVVAELSYSEYGERGSIDLVAWHASSQTLLVVEIKSELVSLEETLRKHDEKVRLAPRIVKDRLGWEVVSVGRLLILPDNSTSRRRVARHAAVLGSVLPIRGDAIRRWLRSPSGPIAGLWFFAKTTTASKGRAMVADNRR